MAALLSARINWVLSFAAVGFAALFVFGAAVRRRHISAQALLENAHKELEAQLRQAQKMEAVGRLAGGVAHDFNNLLTVVSGFTELAIEQLDATSPVRDDLEGVRRAVNSAASLTRQLLIFSRKSIARRTVIDVEDIVTHLDKMLQRLVGGEHFVDRADRRRRSARLRRRE